MGKELDALLELYIEASAHLLNCPDRQNAEPLREALKKAKALLGEAMQGQDNVQSR